MLDKEHDRLFNVSWWAGALIQRRQLDVTEHSGERAHQKVDPDGHALHGPDHVLTEWERGWIRERVIDILRDRLLKREEHAPVLAEPHEEHEARELDLRAKDYFGASHAETRAGFLKKRAEHQKLHAEVHLLQHRPTPDAKLEPIPAEAVAEIRAQHEQAITQIDDYLAPGKGLIDRHIATVKAEVAEKRRVAQLHLDECTKVQEVQFADIVAEYTARVEAEIRAQAQPVVEAESAQE